jgi:hypothetical protein
MLAKGTEENLQLKEPLILNWGTGAADTPPYNLTRKWLFVGVSFLGWENNAGNFCAISVAYQDNLASNDNC